MHETTSTTVRGLRAEDRAAWQRLWDGYLAFYRATVPVPVTDRTFERLCGDEHGELAGLVAVDAQDEPIGLAHLVYHASTWTTAGYCYLEDLYVERAHRGAGAARALIEAAVADAARRGTHRLYWHTQQYNAPARSLYDRAGTPTSFIVYERNVDAREHAE